MDKSKWVSFLPLKLDPEIIKTSIESKSKRQHCHPCERMENEVNASLWCCDCNEALCESCGNVHRHLKILSTHKTVSIETEELDNEIKKILQETAECCSIHENRRIEMYCTDHAQAICIQCLSNDHKKCEQLELIDSIDDLKEERMTTFIGGLGKLLDAVKLLTEERIESKKNLQTMFASIETQSLGTITQLKMKLDDLYIEFLKKAGLQQDEVQDKLDQSLKSLREYSTVLEQMLRNIELAVRYGSKVQILRMTHTIKCTLSEIGENLYSSLAHRSEYKLHGNFDAIVNTFNGITDLGTIMNEEVQRETTCLENISELKNLLIPDIEIEFSSICAISSNMLEFSGKTIVSSVYIDDEKCVMLSFEGFLHVVLTFKNEVLFTITVNAQPKKLCFKTDKNILYGSCNSQLGFYCNVNDRGFEGYKSFTLKSKVSGVDVCSGKGYMISENNILQTEDFEHHETWITSTSISYNDDISFDEKSKRFSFSTCNADGAIIQFGNLSETVRRPFKGNYAISKPQSIAFGPSVLLFVAESSCLIHVISPDEKSVILLLPKLQKIRNITDITVSHDKKKLFVSGGKYVEIYDIRNEKKSK